jgi:hypothetical protein
MLKPIKLAEAESSGSEKIASDDVFYGITAEILVIIEEQEKLKYDCERILDSVTLFLSGRLIEIGLDLTHAQYTVLQEQIFKRMDMKLKSIIGYHTIYQHNR